MFCINCFHAKTQVTNSRGNKKTPQVWRRRNCPSCSFTFTTYESYALDELLLIQSDSDSSPYNRGKLIASLISALSSSRADTADAFWLLQTVEHKLIRSARDGDSWRNVSANQLASLCQETLSAYHTVAGLSYGASHGLIDNTQKRKRGRPTL